MTTPSPTSAQELAEDDPMHVEALKLANLSMHRSDTEGFLARAYLNLRITAHSRSRVLEIPEENRRMREAWLERFSGSGPKFDENGRLADRSNYYSDSWHEWQRAWNAALAAAKGAKP
jgi:hypothetical protein